MVLKPYPPEPYHFNQWHTHSLPGRHSPEHMREPLRLVLVQRDELRLRCEKTVYGWQYVAEANQGKPFEEYDLSDLSPQPRDIRIEEIIPRIGHKKKRPMTRSRCFVIPS
jgi:hypothetical protein